MKDYKTADDRVGLKHEVSLFDGLQMALAITMGLYFVAQWIAYLTK